MAVSHHPDLWEDLLGWYKLSARLSDVRLRGMMGAGIEVFIKDGAPAMRFLTPIPELARGFALHPDDPDDPFVFRMVFGQDPAGMTTRLHLDLMPLTLHKRPAGTNPRRWVLAGSVGCGVAGIVRLIRGASNP